MESLAVHVACGGKIASWAKTHDVGIRTVRTWSARQDFRDRVRAHQAQVAARLLGSHYTLAGKAVARLRKLVDDSDARVAARASEFILTNLVAMANWSDQSAEIEAIKREIEELKSLK